MKTFSIPALCVLVASCAVLPACNGTGVITPAPQPPSAPVTSQAMLRDSLRQLWTDDAIWTRVVVIDTMQPLPDLDTATARLLRNQDDIARSFQPFVTRDAADRLTVLFENRVGLLGAALDAVVTNDAGAYDLATASWLENADQIANVLATANPAWSEADLSTLLRDHVAKTEAEIIARSLADWSRDIGAFDGIEQHGLSIADELTTGLTSGFPDRVSVDAPRSLAADSLHLEMRRLWEEHVAWERFFLISDIAGLDDQKATTDRLIQNQYALGNVVKPYWGNNVGDVLAQLLVTHANGIADLVTATIAGDQPELERVSDAWHANADRIAFFLAAQNPLWNEQDLADMMSVHLQATAAEATTRIRMDWQGDTNAFDGAEIHSLSMADALSDGINAQFPGGPAPPM